MLYPEVEAFGLVGGEEVLQRLQDGCDLEGRCVCHGGMDKNGWSKIQFEPQSHWSKSLRSTAEGKAILSEFILLC